MHDEILDPRDVERVYKISLSTLARLRVAGEGPVYCKVGKKVLYRRSDLDEWIAARRRTSTSDRGNEVEATA